MQKLSVLLVAVALICASVSDKKESIVNDFKASKQIYSGYRDTGSWD